jgi:hypothetical protein
MKKTTYFNQIRFLSEGGRILKVRTVVRHDDSVHVGILDRLNSFEHDRAVPVRAQERSVLPRAEDARLGLAQQPGPEHERLTRNASMWSGNVVLFQYEAVLLVVG